MTRFSKLPALCAALVATLSTMVASAQHVCPNCGRHVAHPTVQVQASQAVPVISGSTANETINEQPLNVIQQVTFEQPIVSGDQIATVTDNSNQVYDIHQSAAQRSADYRASRRIKGHGFTSGYREGVGWSTRSAAEAIRNCCYSTTSLPRRVAVARGSDGWYATTIYLR